MLYPQNGDRIVTIDSVTSLHPVYSLTNSIKASTETLYKLSIFRIRGITNVLSVCLNFTRLHFSKSTAAIGKERVRKIIINNTINLFLNCNQQFANFKP